MLSPDITPVPQAKPFLPRLRNSPVDKTLRGPISNAADALAVWEPKSALFVHTKLRWRARCC
jgi:hypothetical protein